VSSLPDDSDAHSIVRNVDNDYATFEKCHDNDDIKSCEHQQNVVRNASNLNTSTSVEKRGLQDRLDMDSPTDVRGVKNAECSGTAFHLAGFVGGLDVEDTPQDNIKDVQQKDSGSSAVAQVNNHRQIY
jgi:hypothetical protein